MRVLGEIEGVVGPCQGGLEVAQQRVDGPELWQLGAGRTAAGDAALMRCTELGDDREAVEPVGDQRQRQGKRLHREVRHRLLGEGSGRQARLHGLAVVGGLHRRQEGDLVLRASPALAARQLAAEVGVVDLDTAAEPAALLALAHDLHELVLDEPGRAIGHPQVAHEFERRDVVLGLREQVHGNKPARQRQLGGLEDRAADEARLMAAGTALQVQQRAAAKRAVCAGAAARADEALRPAPCHQSLLALIDAAVALHEFGHRQALLELHLVHRHGLSPRMPGCELQPIPV